MSVESRVILMALALLPAIAAADGGAAATRVFEGSGRACYGKLVIAFGCAA